MKAKKIVKVIAFILIFVVCFFTVQGLLTGDVDTRDYRRIKGFFQQEEDSLDAVFLGSSATYAFWTPAFAYREYGITVYPVSNAPAALSVDADGKKLSVRFERRGTAVFVRVTFRTSASAT